MRRSSSIAANVAAAEIDAPRYLEIQSTLGLPEKDKNTQILLLACLPFLTNKSFCPKHLVKREAGHTILVHCLRFQICQRRTVLPRQKQKAQAKESMQHTPFISFGWENPGNSLDFPIREAPSIGANP